MTKNYGALYLITLLITLHFQNSLNSLGQGFHNVENFSLRFWSMLIGVHYAVFDQVHVYSVTLLFYHNLTEIY